jgi:hypothetical protein
MEQVALNTLWLAGLLLPYFVVVVRNSFQSNVQTSVRIVVAIGAGWGLLLGYAFAADAVNRSLATTQEQIDALNNGDGAKFAFAFILGWVLPAIIASVAWLLHAVLAPRIRAKSSNNRLVATGVSIAPSSSVGVPAPQPER